MLTYFDYNATAPVRPRVREAILAGLDLAGNPSSVHRAGRVARRLVEEVRDRMADVSGATPRNVILTGGGTEANNLALRGCATGHLIISAIEHDCVTAAALASGKRVSMVKVLANGTVDLDHLGDLLRDAGTDTLVSIMAVNNETGVIQPVAEAAAIAREAGALFHTDAVQALGKIDLGSLGHACDLITLSAHKVGGAKGAGALIVRDGIELTPMITGGGQEMGRRSGTENVPAIAGFGALLEIDLRAEQKRVHRIGLEIEAALTDAVPGALVIGADAVRTGNTACIALPGVKAETQVMAMDLAGVAVSAGSACSSGKVSRSRVLDAMGYDGDIAGAAIRISWGWATTPEDTARLTAAWRDMAGRLFRGNPAHTATIG